MSPPGGLRRNVPWWFWFPLVLALAAVVVRLKSMQTEQVYRRHEELYAEARAREVQAWRTDSVIRASAPERQRQLMARVDTACSRSSRALPANDTVDIRDYRDASKRVTGWVASATVRDSGLTLTSGPLSYTYDGAWTDSVRRMVVPERQHVVRFSARISFADDPETCILEFAIRDIAMTRIAVPEAH